MRSIFDCAIRPLEAELEKMRSIFDCAIRPLEAELEKMRSVFDPPRRSGTPPGRYAYHP
jgi:hypothetical protein